MWKRFTASARRVRLVIATIAALPAQLLFPAPADAVPLYAFSRNEITNFGFAGSGVLTYNSGHRAQFGAFGSDSHPRGTEKGSTDLPQAKVGPGTPTSMPAVTPPDSRSGARILLQRNGLTGGGEITFRFTAEPFMRVTTSNQGDIASARLLVQLDVFFDPDGSDPERQILEWRPCGNSTDESCFVLRSSDIDFFIGGITDPVDLNEFIRCNAASCDKSWPANGMQQPHDFSITVGGFTAGTVRAILDSIESVAVCGVAAPQPRGGSSAGGTSAPAQDESCCCGDFLELPEPRTSLLLLAGMLGIMGLIRRRSTRAL